MYTPKISIIIPVYNVQEYIADCIYSIMRQNYLGQIECLLIDDCGSDNSMTIIGTILAEYSGSVEFRIIHHPHNLGLSAARNTGIDAAKGEYIYFVDSDDYIADNCLEILAAPLCDYQYDMVLGGLEFFNGQEIVPNDFLNKEKGAILTNEKIFYDFYNERLIYAAAWNKLTKKTLFNEGELSFLEGQIHEDELWMYKCCLNLQSLYIQTEVTYFYRLRSTGIMGTRYENIKKAMQSNYDTADYVLDHPANVDRLLWEKAVVYYIHKFLGTAEYAHLDYFTRYASLRRRFDYHPFQYLKEGKISYKTIKHQFHFLLPPFLGYMYLKVREYKHLISTSAHKDSIRQKQNA